MQYSMSVWTLTEIKVMQCTNVFLHVCGQSCMDGLLHRGKEGLKWSGLIITPFINTYLSMITHNHCDQRCLSGLGTGDTTISLGQVHRRGAIPTVYPGNASTILFLFFLTGWSSNHCTPMTEVNFFGTCCLWKIKNEHIFPPICRFPPFRMTFEPHILYKIFFPHP